MSIKIAFSKTEISSTLMLLNSQYNAEFNLRTSSARSIRLLKTYSKMALMSICGWLEDGIDDLAKKSEIKLKEQEPKKYLNESVNSIYGFHYDKHFRKAIVLAYGIHGLEYIEKKLGTTDKALLVSILKNLKKLRDEAAHSNRAMINYSPSRIIKEFEKIFPIVKNIEKFAIEYRNKKFK